MKRWLVIALVFIFGCGGDDDGPTGTFDAPLAPVFDAPPAVVHDAPPQNDAPIFTQGCTLVLSGAVTATLPCAVTAGKSDDKPFSLFGLASTAGNTSVVLSVEIDGTLSVGTLTVQRGSAQVNVDPSDIYLATKGSDQDIGTLGALQITSLTTLPPTPGATIWSAHGSFTATLTSLTTGTAMVTLSATF
jgi:hypothetical protein